ncbi:MAG: hypothetical protein P0S95_07435 [Rhabdochlamydiaceae bacterium]|nr:hypothetical protein [Candidatus Amphrikana amoebophyrae]
MSMKIHKEDPFNFEGRGSRLLPDDAVNFVEAPTDIFDEATACKELSIETCDTPKTIATKIQVLLDDIEIFNETVELNYMSGLRTDFSKNATVLELSDLGITVQATADRVLGCCIEMKGFDELKVEVKNLKPFE